MTEERVAIGGFSFELLSRIDWISKDTNPWTLIMNTPEFEWISSTIQTTEQQKLEAIQNILEIGLDSVNLELRKIRNKI